MKKRKVRPKIDIGGKTYEYERRCWPITIETKITIINLFDLPLYEDEIYQVLTEDKGWISVMKRNNQLWDEEDRLVSYNKILKRLNVIPAYETTMCSTYLYTSYEYDES